MSENTRKISNDTAQPVPFCCQRRLLGGKTYACEEVIDVVLQPKQIINKSRMEINSCKCLSHDVMIGKPDSRTVTTSNHHFLRINAFIMIVNCEM